MLAGEPPTPARPFQAAERHALCHLWGPRTPAARGRALPDVGHESRRGGNQYLCRLYSTRPDRLGFGAAYSNVQVGHLARAGIADIWPRSSPETYTDLVERVRNAREEITVFGLARNFYAKDEILPLFESKAVAIPVTFFVMDPYCESRRDRYRLEPVT